MESNKSEYKLYNQSVVVCTNEWKQPKCHCDMLLLFPWTNIRHGWLQPILGRTWLEWIHLSRIFRAPFARNRKKKGRYYLLSGLSRIFRKPFANLYISRKVPFAQTFQIYACGLRLYKTFHGFLHDSHIYIYISLWVVLSDKQQKTLVLVTVHFNAGHVWYIYISIDLP